MDFRYARPPPPPPPPAHPSSDSHQPPPVPPPPGTWYPNQFQYHSPSPPPPQWAPQPPHSDHHLPPPPHPPPYAAAAPPPPPMPYSSSNYSIPPRPHMPPPQAHYPPGNQEWSSNPNWGHQGWDYSAHNQNEDDWAARAKAWAASKAVTDDQHQHSQPAPPHIREEINHQNQYSQNLDFQQHSHPPSSYQQYPSSFALPPRPPANHLQESSAFSAGYVSDGQYSYPARDGNFQDPAVVYPHQESIPTSLPVHQQEVPSSYSSVAGKEELSDVNRNFYQPPHVGFARQHHVQPSISPDERSISAEQPHYSFNNSSAEPEIDPSNQPLDFGPRYGHDHGLFGQSGAPGMPYPSMPPVQTPIQQADPSLVVSSPVSMHPTPLFGRISSFQPTMPSANTTFPIGASNAYHGDMYGTPGFPERPKKPSLPNWLREEIKKKGVIGSSAPEVSRQDTESNEDEVMDQKGDQMGGKSMDSSRSTEEEGDDEDYVEAARTAAVNQEIKRILTEVLLKVTDELFDEIATKVLEEDDLNVEVERKADNTSAATTPKSTAKVIIPANSKGAAADDASGKSGSSSPGDVLGLGSYASDDDDDEEKEVQKLSTPFSNNSKPPERLAENGSSKVDEDDVRGEKFLKESDSHRVSPNGAIESHSDKSGGEKVKPDSSDFSKSKQSVIEVGLKTKNSLQDDAQGRSSRNGPDKSGNDKKHNKVDENSRTHDERDIKRAKKEDHSGSKEKTKVQDLGKKVSKAEVKDDKEERGRDKRSREKEDSRKREKEKDDKNERSKYKPVGDSSRHKRYHSPSPGGRGRSSKDNSTVSHAHGSSDSSSDDSRRKLHSKRHDLSPSPVRSRRQVSRSPSKRSHRRQSIYSSLEATRERRRSRSRSRSRPRRG